MNMSCVVNDISLTDKQAAIVKVALCHYGSFIGEINDNDPVLKEIDAVLEELYSAFWKSE